MPISDEEFASIQKGLSLNSIVTGTIVLIILWAALRSLRLVFAVVITLAIGLIVTAGLGLFVVGPFNDSDFPRICDFVHWVERRFCCPVQSTVSRTSSIYRLICAKRCLKQRSVWACR